MSENELGSYELLYMYRQGDLHALNGLMKTIEPSIQKNMFHLKWDNSDVVCYYEDILQDARLAAFEAICYYRFDKDCSLRTFLNLVIARKMRRKVSRYRNLTQNALRIDEPVGTMLCEEASMYTLIPQRDKMAEPEFYSEYMLKKERFMKEVQSLSEKDKQIFQSCLEEGTQKEKSQRCNMHEKAYSSKTFRLKRRLKSAMADEYPL